MKIILFTLFLLIETTPLFCQSKIDTSKIKIVDFGSHRNYTKTIFYPKILDSNYTGIKHITHKMPYSMFNEADYGDYSFIENKKPPIEIIFKVKYKSGIKIKVEGYYKNGTKWYDIPFNKLGRNGIMRQWYNNGLIKSYFVCKDGKLAGVDTNWYSNGNTESITQINGVKKISKSWYKNGVFANETIHPDTSSENYYEKSYHTTGELFLEANFNNGVQPITMYHKNGNISAKGLMVNLPLLKIGKWSYYYKNGAIKEENYYDEINPNIRIGSWKYYSENGKLIKTEIYNKGELIKTEDY